MGNTSGTHAHEAPDIWCDDVASVPAARRSKLVCWLLRPMHPFQLLPLVIHYASLALGCLQASVGLAALGPKGSERQRQRGCYRCCCRSPRRQRRTPGCLEAPPQRWTMCHDLVTSSGLGQPKQRVTSLMYGRLTKVGLNGLRLDGFCHSFPTFLREIFIESVFCFGAIWPLCQAVSRCDVRRGCSALISGCFLSHGAQVWCLLHADSAYPQAAQVPAQRRGVPQLCCFGLLGKSAVEAETPEPASSASSP